MVIRPDTKSDSVSAVQNIVSRDLAPDAIDLLINVGFEESQLRLRDLKCQIAIRGDIDSMDILEFDPDPAGIALWRNDKDRTPADVDCRSR